MKNYRTLVQKSIDFIEGRLEKELQLDELAKLACLSKFHYIRLFSALVGETPKQYIIKRRISQGAKYILSSNEKMIDIAYKYGFNSQADFTRVFKKYYGISPLKCRVQPERLVMYEPVNIMEKVFEDDFRCRLDQPKIIFIEDLHVWGYKTEGNFHDNYENSTMNQFWYRVVPDLLQFRKTSEYTQAYGITLGSEYMGDFRYMVGYEAKDLWIPQEGLEKVVVKGGKYAVFNYKSQGDRFEMRSLYHAMKYIYEEWLPATKYELDDRIELVEIIKEEDFDNENRGLDICFPIK